MNAHISDPRSHDALPRVSVVIPCYNYARYLEDAVRSALVQHGVAVDVTVIDDASTDDSVEVAERLAAEDSRVRLVRHRTNQGHVETSNEALDLAAEEFVVKLDADDLLTPGSLSRSTALLRAKPDVAFCYGYAEQFRGAPPTQVPGRVRSGKVWRTGTWARDVLRSGHNPICQPEVVMRRDAVRASGGYRPKLRWAEDFNLWLRMAAEAEVGRVNGPTQGLYRMHPHSFTRSAADPELKDLRARITAVDAFFDEGGSPLARSDGERRRALAALAKDARIVAVSVADDDAKHTELLGIADELDERSGASSAGTLAARRTPFGALYRDLNGRVRWRRWRRYGI